ncbi:MAG: flagellar hook-length control protein FliK [Paracoccaceae bacterium]
MDNADSNEDEKPSGLLLPETGFLDEDADHDEVLTMETAVENGQPERLTPQENAVENQGPAVLNDDSITVSQSSPTASQESNSRTLPADLDSGGTVDFVARAAYDRRLSREVLEKQTIDPGFTTSRDQTLDVRTTRTQTYTLGARPDPKATSPLHTQFHAASGDTVSTLNTLRSLDRSKPKSDRFSFSQEFEAIRSPLVSGKNFPSGLSQAFLQAIPQSNSISQVPKLAGKALELESSGLALGNSALIDVGSNSGTISKPALQPYAPLRSDTAQHLITQLQSQIVAAGSRVIELTLKPAELGRVSISMNFSDAEVGVVISGDRPETMDLLRRHSEQLSDELEALGLGDVTLEFSEHSRSEDDPEQSQETLAADPDADGSVDREFNGRTVYQYHPENSGLDIRV